MDYQSVYDLRAARNMGGVLAAWQSVQSQEEADVFLSEFAATMGGMDGALENLRFGMSYCELGDDDVDRLTGYLPEPEEPVVLPELGDQEDPFEEPEQ